MADDNTDQDGINLTDAELEALCGWVQRQIWAAFRHRFEWEWRDALERAKTEQDPNHGD